MYPLSQHIITLVPNELLLKYETSHLLVYQKKMLYNPESWITSSTILYSFLKAQLPCFTNRITCHSLTSCPGLFVVSSNNTDPLNAFQSLSSALDSQQPSDSIHSKWFSTNIFKYYLMIHDVTDGVQNK